ncbi:MAG: PE-PPE domain-containing protein, partial [Candidatus Nanopelagicales bacterium]
MRRISSCFIGALLSVSAALMTALPSPIRPVVGLTATALYMGGTGHPLSVPEDTPAFIQSYVQWAYDGFVGPSGLCTGGNPGCTQVATFGPQEFWPLQGLRSLTFDASVAAGLTNLNNCLRGTACTLTPDPFTATVSQPLTDNTFTVFGNSQSGTIATLEKSNLIAHPSSGTVSFFFVANPNRPNGGILQRFVGAYIPILGVTFNGATATNSPEPSPLTTLDAAHQYDPIADFPTNPLNLLADLNALMGFRYEHADKNPGKPLLQGQFQDSTYYIFPTVDGILPLIRPLNLIPLIGPLIATILDPPLRVLVETGYDRTINPGTPTSARILYFPNPVSTILNFLTAIPTGWDNGIASLTGDPTNRPFGTSPQSPYGVGGPPVYAGAIDPYGPPTPYTLNTAMQTSSSTAAQILAPRSKAMWHNTSTEAKPVTAGNRRRPRSDVQRSSSQERQHQIGELIGAFDLR